MPMCCVQAELNSHVIKLRESYNVLGMDSAPDIAKIKGNPSEYLHDPSPIKREMATAQIRRDQAETALQAERDRREAERAKNQRAVARLGSEQQVFAQYRKEADEWVQLNVGGEMFTTSRSTLLAADEGSPLEVLFSGRHGDIVPVDDAGNRQPVFLDRDPKGFTHILRYLREIKGTTVVTEEMLNIPKDELGVAMAEAKHFKLKSLVALINSRGESSLYSPTLDVIVSMMNHWEDCLPHEDISPYRRLSFRGMSFRGLIFRGFIFCLVQENNYVERRLKFGTDFSYCDLRGCDFSHSILDRNVEKTRPDFQKAYCLLTTFANADLRGCNFTNTDVSKCDLSGAHTEGAIGL